MQQGKALNDTLLHCIIAYYQRKQDWLEESGADIEIGPFKWIWGKRSQKANGATRGTGAPKREKRKRKERPTKSPGNRTNKQEPSQLKGTTEPGTHSSRKNRQRKPKKERKSRKKKKYMQTSTEASARDDGNLGSPPFS